MNPPVTQWVVTVDDEHRDHVHAVADELRTCGFEVERVLTVLGQITGRADDSCVESMSAVAGVEDVTANTTMRIPESDTELGR